MKKSITAVALCGLAIPGIIAAANSPKTIVANAWGTSHTLYVVGSMNSWTTNSASHMTYSKDVGNNVEYVTDYPIAMSEGNDFLFRMTSESPTKDFRPALMSGNSFTHAGGNANIIASKDIVVTFYLQLQKDGNWNGVYWDETTAQTLAYKLNQYAELEGHCGDEDRFPACKTFYLGLEEGEKAAFQSYADSTDSFYKGAYDRYVAWADALGQNRWTEGALGGAATVEALNKTDYVAYILPVTFGAVILGVGAFFVIRKKKAE